jgi:thermopsin
MNLRLKKPSLGRTSISLLALSLLLLAVPSAVGGAKQQSAPLPYNVLISPGYFEYFQVNTVAASSEVTLSVSSNASLSTAFMTSSQLVSFNNSESDLSSSVYLFNGSTVQHTVHESKGTYYLVFYGLQNTANVSYNYVTYPIDPYYLVPPPTSQPTGIASFGLYNMSGNPVPYEVKADQVVGIADISALQAYNATAGLDNSTISGATLQLNSVLLVNESGGQQQSYWVQNTPDFVTAASQVAFGDNVWNFSVSGYLDNNTITSADGGVANSFPNPGGPLGYYYSEEGNNMTYSFPLSLALLMNETVDAGQGVVVGMGAQLLRNGGAPASPIDWFDTVTIHDATVQSAYFFVSGNKTTPDGLYYDTELVWGGEANGEETNFTQMNSSLGLFYQASSGGVLDSFPSFYTFGGDTAEAADNLQVSYTGNGFSHISTGTPNYVYLGQASGTLSFPLSISNITSSIGSSAISSLSQGQTSTTSTQTSSPTTSTSTSSSDTALPFSYLLVLALTGTAMVAMAGVGARSRTRT